MPALDHNLVTGWFISRAKPYASQFAAWINACWFKGEKIPVTDISGMDDYFGSVIPAVIVSFDVNSTYTIPAGYSIFQMYMNSNNANATIRIGSALTLDDIMSDTDILSGRITPLSIIIPAQETTDIFISGVTGATTLRIYLHKI